LLERTDVFAHQQVAVVLFPETARLNLIPGKIAFKLAENQRSVREHTAAPDAA
jgi:hypothetical protein